MGLCQRALQHQLLVVPCAQRVRRGRRSRSDNGHRADREKIVQHASKWSGKERARGKRSKRGKALGAAARASLQYTLGRRAFGHTKKSTLDESKFDSHDPSTGDGTASVTTDSTLKVEDSVAIYAAALHDPLSPASMHKAHGALVLRCAAVAKCWASALHRLLHTWRHFAVTFYTAMQSRFDDACSNASCFRGTGAWWLLLARRSYFNDLR